jgi:hypothetical protein
MNKILKATAALAANGGITRANTRTAALAEEQEKQMSAQPGRKELLRAGKEASQAR